MMSHYMQAFRSNTLFAGKKEKEAIIKITKICPTLKNEADVLINYSILFTELRNIECVIVNTALLK